jgi:hypothetical protein
LAYRGQGLEGVDEYYIESEGPRRIVVLEEEEEEEEEDKKKRMKIMMIIILTCALYTPQPDTKVHYSNAIFKSPCI